MSWATWRRLGRDPAGQFGLALVVLFACLSIASGLGWLGGDWASPVGDQWEAPNQEHWFGTNRLGQDIFDRALASIGTAFRVGLLVAVASTLFGALFGALAGWRPGGWVDDAVLWLKGVLDSIPFYLLAAALAYALGGGVTAMYAAMIATFWTPTGRLVRGEVLRLRERDFVLSAQAIALPSRLILWRHVLPSTLPVLLVQATLTFVAAIKTEVILSFLGIGMEDGISWGIMLAESTQDVLAGHFGNFLAASLMLFGLLLAFNLLSDALQDALDVRGVNR